MDFARFSGMFTVAILLLVLALAILQPGDIAPTLWTLFGQAVTVAVGGWAWYGVRKQMAVADEQLQIARDQAAETRTEIRRGHFLRLQSQVQRIADDIDRLQLARGYLATFAARFPDEGLDGWTIALSDARNDAHDFVSQSAISAPRYGSAIATVMSRIQTIGDRLDRGDTGYRPVPTLQKHYDPIVREAIEGLRRLIAQIDAEIPRQRTELANAMDERNLYA